MDSRPLMWCACRVAGHKRLSGSSARKMVQCLHIAVTVLANGFEYQGRHYGSLSAIATEVTGTRWNGVAFFGLTRMRCNTKGRGHV